jgi:hypothetical protein
MINALKFPLHEVVILVKSEPSTNEAVSVGHYWTKGYLGLFVFRTEWGLVPNIKSK